MTHGNTRNKILFTCVTRHNTKLETNFSGVTIEYVNTETDDIDKLDQLVCPSN